ncbi:hypothetical protein B5F76_08315 [Desulfovibrio sp. An276]|nr:hypothetical protein B5F76_08315 [Desulfovibrio sp. An276]
MANETPIISPVLGRTVYPNNKYSRLYGNPHFDYLSEMLPKNIKDLFRWCEVVYNSMPTVANAIRKLVHYPITDFSFEDQPEKMRDKTKKLLDDIHMKSILMDFNTDFYIYGNVFRTVYMPFKRFIQCSHCNERTAIDNSTFRVRRQKIEVKCKNCGWQLAKLHDEELNDPSKIVIVRWDPKSINLVQNPITGTTEYYYQMPEELTKRIQQGDKTIFRDTPQIFIEGALKDKNIKFGPNFYHAKMPSLSGYQSGWGISQLMSTLRIYMYIAVLRRASEAIGMEHITPQRILFPQSSGTSDPAVGTSLKRWREEVNKALERWRFDPNYVMTAPYPTGLVNIGSQGRQLSPIEEIKDARVEMTMALDIPPALLTCDASIQASAIGLRILENQLTPHVREMERFMRWVIDAINAHTGMEYTYPSLVPFKLADDIMNKQMLMQLAANGTVSRTTILESLNIDPAREKELLKSDTVSDQIMQQEVQEEVNKQLNSLSNQVKSQVEESQTGMPSQYNQQKMIAQAQQIANQMLSVPYEQRKSQLSQLQNEDYVMWALVSKQLEQMRTMQAAQMAQTAQTQSVQG